MKHPRRTPPLLALAATLAVAAATPALTAQVQHAAGGEHVLAPDLMAHAARIDGAITVDGRLDEAAWQTATPITAFLQVDPREGEPVSQPTEVRVLYSADALYVGAVLRDAGAISRPLGRHDADLPHSDWFGISIDSYHDHLSAFTFQVNPAGVRTDALLYGDAEDRSWDAVWRAETTVTDTGWTVEMRIPFSQLRFGRSDAQTWGLQIWRRIGRHQELAVWAFTPKSERGGVARYGHLTGLQQIRRGRPVQVLPYTVARARYEQVSPEHPFRSDSEYRMDAGVDLKYRVTSNLTLDATANPDFGQVEVDPAVINLTAFETFYSEKRPFFMEGTDIFDFGASQLFYSRRIGAAPQGRTPQSARFSDMPETARILGAAKLTGKTGGWSVGVLDAVTGREVAPFVTAEGTPGQIVAEPLTNYFLGRVRRDVAGGRSMFGGIVTAVNRSLDDEDVAAPWRSSAYAGGVDFRHEWAQRTWSVSGSVSGSAVNGSTRSILAAQRSSARYYQRPDADYLALDPEATSLHGYAVRMDVGRRAGLHWLTNLSLSAISPGYEVNDLGFQSIADRLTAEGHLTFRQTRPGPRLRNWSLSAVPSWQWNYGGEVQRANMGLTGRAQLLNFMTGYLSYTHYRAVNNDRLTRGGPSAAKPSGNELFYSFSGDPRKSVVAALSGTYWQSAAGEELWFVRLGATLKPAASWNLSVAPRLSGTRMEAQYIGAVPDTLEGSTYGVRYVFAGETRRNLSLETRLNMIFRPGLTLELFAQPLVASGAYGSLKQLRAPNTYEFDRYGFEIGTMTRTDDGVFVVDPDGSGPAGEFRVRDPDFNIRTLRGNAVLRWEWQPGSTLTMAWQQRRNDHERVGDMVFRRDVGALFDTRPDNVFVLKVNYWLNL
jgi:hypothetical protein